MHQDPIFACQRLQKSVIGYRLPANGKRRMAYTGDVRNDSILDSVNRCRVANLQRLKLVGFYDISEPLAIAAALQG